jgi:hypothetical protein
MLFDMPTVDNKSLLTDVAIEPCIIMGCTQEYGHGGSHDLCKEFLKEQLVMAELRYEDTDLGANHE